MADLPSSGDDNWDAWLGSLIENIRKKQWLNVLSQLNTMTKQALYELSDALKGRVRG